MHQLTAHTVGGVIGQTGEPVALIIPDADKLRVDAKALAELKNVKLVSGMPVEAFAQTAPPTIMSDLVRPLTDQVSRAFREK